MSAKGVAVVTEIDWEGQGLGGGARSLQNNYCGTVEIRWPAHVGQQENREQDAQKGDLLIRPPWRAKTRLVRRQARSSAADPRFTFHASRITVGGSEARTPLAVSASC